jgi:hypothetical protein
MEEETIGEQIIEAIEEDVKQMPQFFKNEHTEFQDRHTAMQTYLMFRMLEEIEGIHNGFFVLYNEKKANQEEENQSVDPDTAITAFMGWLTSRDEVSGPFSSRHDPSVDLIRQFCEAQGWHASDERFHQQIKALKQKYPSS